MPELSEGEERWSPRRRCALAHPQGCVGAGERGLEEIRCRLRVGNRYANAGRFAPRSCFAPRKTPQLPLQNAYFCSQTCFKAAWSEHKKIHKLGKQLQAAQAAKLLEERKGQEIPPELRQTLPDWARNYRFSGTLRPAQQSPRRSIPSHIPRPDYATHPSGISHSEQSDKTSGKSIKSYSGEELERVKHACKMGREVLDLAGKALRVGVTCDEIDRVVHEGEWHTRL